MTDNKHSKRYLASERHLKQVLSEAPAAHTHEEAMAFLSEQQWTQKGGGRLETVDRYQDVALAAQLAALNSDTSQTLAARMKRDGVGFMAIMDAAAAKACFDQAGLPLTIMPPKELSL